VKSKEEEEEEQQQQQIIDLKQSEHLSYSEGKKTPRNNDSPSTLKHLLFRTKQLGRTSTLRDHHGVCIEDAMLDVLQVTWQTIMAENHVVPDDLIGIHLPFQAWAL